MKNIALCLILLCCVRMAMTQDTLGAIIPYTVQQIPGMVTRDSDLVIYPNVNHGSFTLQVNDSSGLYFDLRIIDGKGRIVKLTRLSKKKGIQTLHFNLLHASKGVYTIQAIGRKAISTAKMTVY